MINRKDYFFLVGDTDSAFAGLVNLPWHCKQDYNGGQGGQRYLSVLGQ
jgi:hypothetical protein